MNLESLAAIGQFPLLGRSPLIIAAPNGFNFKGLAVLSRSRCFRGPVLKVGGCFAASEIDGQWFLPQPRSAAAPPAAPPVAPPAATPSPHPPSAATDPPPPADSTATDSAAAADS